MTTEFLQIDPTELRFVFELKKQSSCLIQLANKVDQYIAFKVKTTSPKKYCVRPNIGIIKPKGKCDFTVTMQAQQTAPPNMHCKDKFLIQSTVVPFGVTEDDITSDMFTKDIGKYIEEKKLKVVLISPPPSPVLLPMNGDVKQDPSDQINVLKDRVPRGVENIPPPLRVSAEKGLEPVLVTREDKTDEDIVPRHAENVGDMKPAKDDALLNLPPKGDVQLNLAKGCEELKSRLGMMDLKLREAEVTILRVNEERRANTKDKDLLKKELEVMKRKVNVKVQAGFPLLFVYMVALVGVAVGYYIHPVIHKA
ncbi:vesicle-associated protein 2-2-like isoform X2 [Cicer arietinum]|uniref:Vesicle-associated protein 1-2-like isoform X2 n=1 Tax=Cicer arietinum TaxID=3827 RepID=A0A1S3ECH3_CICAR|nr:vesicle-associated protein 1-2-like isoform X2 [Cicer arietinum]